MKAFCFLCVLLVLVFLLTSCLAGPNTLEKTPDPKGRVAGFFKGIWHGLLAPITFIVSIFTKN
ncbi:MAG: hypothetical protein ACE5LV_03795, partial [Candidatus Aminicenantales bacterium]